MLGNVREWVWDVYGPYQADSVHNPTGKAAGHRRIHRGAGYVDSRNNMRISYRNHDDADYRSESLGFRLIRTIE